jgi:hypothetical protein
VGPPGESGRPGFDGMPGLPGVWGEAGFPGIQLIVNTNMIHCIKYSVILLFQVKRVILDMEFPDKDIKVLLVYRGILEIQVCKYSINIYYL